MQDAKFNHILIHTVISKTCLQTCKGDERNEMVFPYIASEHDLIKSSPALQIDTDRADVFC